ncbi:MAG: PilZ domain-containing protein [Candidatus Omnitrophica bacterium]|nr:PilZ domain-containing protein [Candidatus Omnitrophota bacterium]
MDERRKVTRWEVNQPAELTMDEECANGIPCRVKDISLKGMSLSLPRKLLPEALSRIKINLADRLQLHTDAFVVWSQESEEDCSYGLCFNNLDETYRTKIYEYVESNFPEELRKQWWKGIG